MDFSTSVLYGKKISRVEIQLHKLGGIPSPYLKGKDLFTKTYIPYEPTIVKKNAYELIMELFGVDLELDSEEIRLRYEMASYNFRRFLKLTGM